MENKTYNEEEKNFLVKCGIHESVEPLYNLLKDHIEAHITARLLEFNNIQSLKGSANELTDHCTTPV